MDGGLGRVVGRGARGARRGVASTPQPTTAAAGGGAAEPARESVVRTKIAGVSHYQEAVARLAVGDVLDVVPEPLNPFDPQALSLRRDGEVVGYLSRDFVAELAGRGLTHVVVDSMGRPPGAGADGGLLPIGVHVVANVAGEFHTRATSSTLTSASGGGASLPSAGPRSYGPPTPELLARREAESLAAMRRVGLRPSAPRVPIVPDGEEQGSLKWHEKRKDRLTASALTDVLQFFSRSDPIQFRGAYAEEAAVFPDKELLGRLQTPLGLAWARRVGIAEPFRGNAATRHGSTREKDALKAYKGVTANKVVSESFTVYWDPKDPATNWLGASPDGLILRDGCRSEFQEWMLGDGLIEIKCPISGIKDVVPSYYVPQMQMQMEVLDKEWVDFVQFVPAESSPTRRAEMSVHRINREPELWADMMELLYDFQFNRVLPAKEAGPTLAEKLIYAPAGPHPLAAQIKRQCDMIARNAECFMAKQEPGFRVDVP